MRYFLTTFLFLLSLSVSSQDLEKEAVSILKEAKVLLEMEQASWHATDHFLASYPDKRNEIRGYFSYVNQNNDLAAVFYGEGENKLLARYEFKGVPSPERLSVNTENLIITEVEADLLEIRKEAYQDMVDNEDRFYSFYENVNPNLIPIIYKGEKKVYLISGSSEPKMLLGNDYRLLFNKKNKLKNRVQLHKSIIPFNYEENKNVLSSIHSHVVSDFITVTDICTHLLYKNYTNIGSHIVMSKK
jgi:hypothetical protein